MGRKKKKKPIKVFCYYCERDFDDESVLVQHQRAKHFKCHVCYKLLSSGGGLEIHLQQVHREHVDKVPNALPGRDSTDIDIFGMQGIPDEILAAHYGEDPLANQVNVDIADEWGVTCPAPLPYGIVQHTYNPVGLQPIIWSHPPQPLPGAPHRPAYPIPPAPPAVVQVQLQPLRPIQNVTEPSIHITAPGRQTTFQVSPTSISTSTTLASCHTDLNSSVELKSMSNIAPDSQDDAANRKSHMNASGPNTVAPSILEVYLLWDDEIMSMEERRLGLPNYQVHGISQMEYIGPAKRDIKIELS